MTYAIHKPTRLKTKEKSHNDTRETNKLWECQSAYNWSPAVLFVHHRQLSRLHRVTDFLLEFREFRNLPYQGNLLGSEPPTGEARLGHLDTELRRAPRLPA